MAVVIGDCVHFLVEFGGKMRNCECLISPSRTRRAFEGRYEPGPVPRDLEKHRVEIERIAVAKLESGHVSLLGIILTIEDLNR